MEERCNTKREVGISIIIVSSRIGTGCAFASYCTSAMNDRGVCSYRIYRMFQKKNIVVFVCCKKMALTYLYAILGCFFFNRRQNVIFFWNIR